MPKIVWSYSYFLFLWKFNNLKFHFRWWPNQTFYKLEFLNLLWLEHWSYLRIWKFILLFSFYLFISIKQDLIDFETRVCFNNFIQYLASVMYTYSFPNAIFFLKKPQERFITILRCINIIIFSLLPYSEEDKVSIYFDIVFSYDDYNKNKSWNYWLNEYMLIRFCTTSDLNTIDRYFFYSIIFLVQQLNRYTKLNSLISIHFNLVICGIEYPVFFRGLLFPLF